MGIENLSDQEKSVMLAKLMGWNVINVKRDSGAWCRVLCDENKTEILPTVLFGGGVEPKPIELKPIKRFNLYEPESMALAWRVLNWANHEWNSGFGWMDGFWTWFGEAELFKYPPPEAQRLWLDKILSFAIVRGMIETPEKEHE